MPKIKTHTGAKKRFKLTKSGQIKHGSINRRHFTNGHGYTAKRRRQLRKADYVDSTKAAQIKRLLPYN